MVRMSFHSRLMNRGSGGILVGGDMALASGHHFKRLRGPKPKHKPTPHGDNPSLLALLSSEIAERFAPFAERTMRAIPLAIPDRESGEDPPPNPCHPACVRYAKSDYCRESWQLHLAELKNRPETHWHKCDHGKLCAYVPLVHEGRCLAAIKLACAENVAEEDFERHLAFLDLLVEVFLVSRADFLGRLPRPEPATVSLGGPGSQGTEEPVERRPRNGHVRKALQYIEGRLCDPKLTVAGIARELEINPNYLSQLFAEQTGRRMSQLIAARRVDWAKTLLTTTDWQIKRIAHETGHANHNWFCYVFRTLTGLTPGDYRRASRPHRDRTSA